MQSKPAWHMPVARVVGFRLASITPKGPSRPLALDGSLWDLRCSKYVLADAGAEGVVG